MINATVGLGVILAYMGLLLVLALWAEGSRAGRRIAAHPMVYSLSLGIYCTSWTYYGSVGFATRTGLEFMAIYIGPTLCVMLWWVILRRLVHLKAEHRTTSIADLIAARYDRSQAVAALATLVAVLAGTPYIALQLKSVISTFGVIVPDPGPGASFVHTLITQNFGSIVVVLMVGFTIAFGVRRVDPTERHRGMIAAVALESVVKLVAFLAAGIFVTVVLFDGPADILDRLRESRFYDSFSLFGNDTPTYAKWTSLTILSMSAVLFLPRQFHVAVVESSDERHILTAMWVFPLYMLLINLFVVPIAMGGLTTGLPIQQADTFVLRLPLAGGQRLLALFVFLGGFSAAMSMVMISSMTLSTMVVNHLLLPLIQSRRILAPLRQRVRECRWVTVAFVVGVGYAFERAIGGSYILVNIGLIAFSGVLQFAPPIIVGLFSRRANKAGALLGLGGGVAVWAYSHLLPAIIRSGPPPTTSSPTDPWASPGSGPRRCWGSPIWTR